MIYSKGNIQDHMAKTLPLARATYGSKNQIIVTMEELSELSCALAKFCRYEDEGKAIIETKEKVIGEVADVLIVLEYVHAIFGYDMHEVYAKMKQKLIRLDGWLEKSDSIQQTTIDRSLTQHFERAIINPCEGCVGEHKAVKEDPCSTCPLITYKLT